MRPHEAVLELLFPTRCAFCHRPTFRHEPVCPRCPGRLPWTPLGAQKRKLPYLDACLSPLYYEGDVRASLLRFKFHSVVSYAEIYADFLVKLIDENQIFCDSITWVPLSRKRRRKRGYDQARLIAEALAKKTGLPCVRALEKWRDTPPQSLTERHEDRRKNIAGVYRVPAGADPAGKSFYLVDDIVTTGATLSEAASVLRRAGAKSVVGLTVARRRHE